MKKDEFFFKRKNVISWSDNLLETSSECSWSIFMHISFTIEYKGNSKQNSKIQKNVIFFVLGVLRAWKWIRNIPKMFPTTYPTMKSHFFDFKTKFHFFQKSLPSSLKPTVMLWKTSFLGKKRQIWSAYFANKFIWVST